MADYGEHAECRPPQGCGESCPYYRKVVPVDSAAGRSASQRIKDVKDAKRWGVIEPAVKGLLDALETVGMESPEDRALRSAYEEATNL